MNDILMPLVIRNEEQYERALEYFEKLMDLDPEDGTKEANIMDTWGLLIKEYEDEVYPMDLPDPIGAIRFYMDQLDLQPKDMIPFIGSKSKVSEVLNYKRPLNLNMIHRLHHGLGIPYESLMKDNEFEISDHNDIEWSRFPITEMFNRGWIKNIETVYQAKEIAEEIIRDFMTKSGINDIQPLLARQNIRQGSISDHYALLAWRMKLMIDVNSKSVTNDFIHDRIDETMIQDLLQFSKQNDGPLHVEEYLNRYGIYFVIEPHLKKTFFDGACFLSSNGHPIIALTLRYDRLDNFWFTLVHELVHVWKHYDLLEQGIYDDTVNTINIDELENMTNQITSDILIPDKLWNKIKQPFMSVEYVRRIAKEVDISAAIIAGRYRRETRNYKILNTLVGSNKLRFMFGITK